MKSLTLTCAAALGFLVPVQSHIMMVTPTPYGKSTLNNSPLAADGSDFPCKQRTGVYDDQGASNSAAVGQSVPLTFTGSAVHGGGSCQISLTTDKQPTKSSKWFVIHSYEGGCPAKNMVGNAPDGTSGTDNYTFKVPDGVAPGDYTLAWTWFNRIGNREMYMNCAPFTVTGGSTKRRIEARKEAERMVKRQSSFPSMYVANACGGCTTPDDSRNLQFPDPGANTDIFVSNSGSDNMNLLVMPTCSCNGPVTGSSSSSSGASSGASSGSGSSSTGGSATSAAGQPLGQATGSAAAGGASTAASEPAAAQPTSSAASEAAPSAATAATSAAEASAAPSAATSATAAAAAPSSASSGSASGSSGSSSGSSSGGSQSCSGTAMVCSSDGSMFGLCDTNGQAVMRAVAPGTVCQNGAIAAKPVSGSS